MASNELPRSQFCELYTLIGKSPLCVTNKSNREYSVHFKRNT